MADNRNPASDDQNSRSSTHSDGNDQWVIITLRSRRHHTCLWSEEMSLLYDRFE